MCGMNKVAFAVQAGTFEGPFATLLAMVEKKKLHISEVSLASIADEYSAYVRANEFQLREATAFVYTAATLMLIKSRHLLPQFLISQEEEEDIADLEKRLKIYAIFKEQMRVIEKHFGTKRIYERIFRRHAVIEFRPDDRITLEHMRQSIEGVFTTVEPETFMPEKQVSKTLSLAEITQSIRERVHRFIEVYFHELAQGLDRKEQAISFLAILELFKQGEVDLYQQGHFETINVTAKASYIDSSWK